MDYIDNLEEFLQRVNESVEPIAFPIHDAGLILLDFFRYTNKNFRYNHVYQSYSRFLCITCEKLPGAWIYKTIQKLQVIPLRYLVPFKETGTFFVAAPKKHVEPTTQLLENFGCKNIVVISDSVISQMKDKIDELTLSGHVMNWHLDYFLKKIDDFEFRIAEQNELCRTNTKAFEEYRNAFRGKKVVIVAGGPTTQYYRQMEDAIHIGINFAWTKENFSFDYLFTHDRKGNKKYSIKTDGGGAEKIVRMEDGFDKIKEKVFICRRVDRTLPWLKLNYGEDIALRKKNVVRFFSSIHVAGETVYQDICSHPLADFYSTIFGALHFALFTYPKEIYLVGCDVSYVGHFYDPAGKSKLNVPKIKIGYSRMKMFAEHHYPGTAIISINPVGLKGLFRDVYTEEYQNQLNEKFVVEDYYGDKKDS